MHLFEVKFFIHLHLFTTVTSCQRLLWRFELYLLIPPFFFAILCLTSFAVDIILPIVTGEPSLQVSSPESSPVELSNNWSELSSGFLSHN